LGLVGGVVLNRSGRAVPAAQDGPATESNSFRLPGLWQYSAPLISPGKRDAEPSQAQKDPSVVFDQRMWHVFMTVKLPGRSAIEYCSFDKWEDANRSRRTILPVSTSKYCCAPQVFDFTPQIARARASARPAPARRYRSGRFLSDAKQGV